MKKKIISISALIISVAAMALAIYNLLGHSQRLTNIVWAMVFLAMVLNWWRAEEDYLGCIYEKHEVIRMKLAAEQKEKNIKLYLESVQNEFLWADQDEFTRGECVAYLQKELNKWDLGDKNGTTSD